ncbi:MAG: hypothetical protein RMJ07_01815 [Nitrososphaerota archaeon]|nr:hypothetical protein [Candidatus Bathyarchaeota archaeon]MDW8048405.1 hypothetical protein [Nitrososphaerota archaeon]
MNELCLPELALKVVLSGLLNSRWGRFNRSTIVRFFIYGNNVKIGIGEGNIHQWEIDALNTSPIRREWHKIKMPNIVTVAGTKFIPGSKIFGMPRELIPVRSNDIKIFISNSDKMIFPAYRCFDIDFGMGRVISVISPKTLIKDIEEAVHQTLPNKRYRRRVDNVEVNIETLTPIINKGFDIGVLKRKAGLSEWNEIEALPVLGQHDLLVILENLAKKPSESLV